MKPTVGIVAQGAMGAGLARVLTGHGVSVLTDLAGRSAASATRAAAAGMRAVEASELAGCDILLSVLPPGEALSFARRMAPLLRSGRRKPVFADCNAVSPQTVGEIERSLGDTGVVFADVGIIGLPPSDTDPGPRLYAAGHGGRSLTTLNDYGLDIRLLDGPVGTASALKMSYAGITKGLLAVASAMILGATRAGVADALAREFAESDPRLLEVLSRRIPNMLPKAYRWVEEMRQIGEFVLPDSAAATIYQGAAELFDRIARDAAGNRVQSAALLKFGDHRAAGLNGQ